MSGPFHTAGYAAFTGKAIGPALVQPVEQLAAQMAEQIAEANRRMAEQATQTAEAQAAVLARLEALERSQSAPRGIRALFRRRAA